MIAIPKINCKIVASVSKWRPLKSFPQFCLCPTIKTRDMESTVRNDKNFGNVKVQTES